MSLDTAKARELLPCFVCGDLPEAVAAQVQAVLDADPELAAQAADMRDAEQACRALMAELADQLPELGPLPAPPPAPIPGPGLAAPRALLAAAAGLLVVLGATAWLGAQQAPLDGLLDRHAPFAAAADVGFIAEADPATLRAALLDAGAIPGLAMVPDLSHLGYTVVGGQVTTDRPGAVIVYDKDGRRYVCQMYSGAPPSDTPQAVSTVGGTLLRGFQQGPTSVVVWQAFGMVCLFSAELPLDQLMAAVEQRMQPAG